MEVNSFLYLAMVMLLLAVSLFFSLKKPKQFLADFKYFLPALLFTGVIFIIWNIRFEKLGIWVHNPGFVCGISILKIPLESWLFIVAISLAMFQIYRWLKTRPTMPGTPNHYLLLSLFLLAVFAFAAWHYKTRLYTFFTFFLLTVYLGYTIFRNRFKQHLPGFYLSLLLALIPFAIMKILLVRLTALSYHPMHISGINILGMPIEDFGYLFLMSVMNISIFEYLKERSFY